MNILYTIIILPIVQIIEFVFVFFDKIFHSLVISLIGVSFIVSLLSLPLYIIAEKWQIIERNTINKLKPKINKIKAVFIGDEQFLTLSTLYKQNNYHPIYGLRSTLGLFIQIPFFIAAYSYLSNLTILNGVNFYFIKDLAKPDSLIKFNNFSINLLPFIMTIINYISCAIYTKELSIRDKIQVYGIGFIFLLILYNSPSCLVIYWTLNNIFSLIKNIFYKIKNPKKIIYLCGCIIITLLNFYLLFYLKNRVLSKRILVSLIISLFYLLPFAIKYINFIYNNIILKLQNKKYLIISIILSCISLTILTGIFIPSSIISSSPEEFCFIEGSDSPFPYVLHSFLFYFGFFFVWPLSIYLIINKKFKLFMIPLLNIIFIISSFYSILFGGNYGIINNIFNFSTTSILVSELPITLLSISIIFPIIVLILLLIKNNKFNYLISISIILLLSIFTFSLVNISKIYLSYNKLKERIDLNVNENSLEPIFSLSKENNNIIIFMADGAVNGFVPLIFNDHPDLYNIFDGFTLYPNTASFSNHTLMAVPPLWGGYDFTPMEMNKNDQIPLVNKHNNALLTIPHLLNEIDYNVYVTDPSWANYAWIPDLSIYDKYENISAINTERKYSGLWYNINDPLNKSNTFSKIKRNILWFSFFKISIPPLREIIYDNGFYWSTDKLGTSITDFINSYSFLDFLIELTNFNSKKSSALLITNDINHKFAYLDNINYKPTNIFNKISNNKYSDDVGYHTNTALYLKLGEWFNYLKENNVYDNTKIIIVADHGSGINKLISNKSLNIKGESRELYNPVLLVKDFNEKGQLKINNNFMTNADVPSLAFKNIISNPVNPFTGNPINMLPKNDGIYISISHIPMANSHGKYKFKIKNNQWIFLQKSIYNSANWERVTIED